MKPLFLLDQNGNYNFEESDKFVDYAIENNLTIIGHTLFGRIVLLSGFLKMKWKYYFTRNFNFKIKRLYKNSCVKIQRENILLGCC